LKTRDKILATALELFNSQGVSAVSSRTISEHVGISYGNLCYHFPQKNDIIQQLYLDLQHELDESFSQLRTEILGFDFMIRSLRSLLEIEYKYKFIFLGNTYLSRNFPDIRDHAKARFGRRKALLFELADFLTQGGYMRVDKVEGHNDRLIHSLLIILNSWIMDSEIFYEGDEEGKIDYYLELLYSAARPSLTKAGLRAFDKVYDERRK
jgi:AcrR family transcriptional regulator